MVHSNLGRARASVVTLSGGVVSCVDGREVSGIIDAAVAFSDDGPDRTGSVAVCASLALARSPSVTRLAASFVRHRLGRARPALVLRTYSSDLGDRPLTNLAPIPVRELADGAEADLLVPVGEAAVRRYATPDVTVALAPRVDDPTLAASLVAHHRLFMGRAHCQGDAALLGIAETGVGDDAELNSALALHEMTVVAELLAGARPQST